MANFGRDPYGGYNFAVEIDGINRMSFRTCSGLDSSSTVTRYREGTDKNLASRAINGLVSYSNISLGWGLVEDTDLLNWREDVQNGKLSRKNLSIVLRDEEGNEKMRWNVKNCWPAKWTGPSFDATSDALAIVSLELAHEGVERQR